MNYIVLFNRYWSWLMVLLCLGAAYKDNVALYLIPAGFYALAGLHEETTRYYKRLLRVHAPQYSLFRSVVIRAVAIYRLVRGDRFMLLTHKRGNGRVKGGAIIEMADGQQYDLLSQYLSDEKGMRDLLNDADDLLNRRIK